MSINPEQLRSNDKIPTTSALGVKDDLDANLGMEAGLEGKLKTDGKQLGTQINKGRRDITTPLSNKIHDTKAETINGYTTLRPDIEGLKEAQIEAIKITKKEEARAEAEIQEALNETEAPAASIDKNVATINAERDEELAGVESSFSEGTKELDEEQSISSQRIFGLVEEEMRQQYA